MLSFMKTAMKWVNRLCELVLAVLLAVMTAVVFVQVACRAVGTGFDFTEELARYLMVASVLVGAAVGVYRGGNIGIEAVVKRLPPKARKAAAVAVDALCLVLFGEIVRYSLRVIPIVSRQKWASLDLSMGIPYWFILIASAVIFLHILVHLLETILEKADG
ncbi:MAG: TRAP transporter small permease [Planctomycetota bacterium]|jgi:C4-dicarboxylate transporter DctQ subunit|nr:TRAP transporter small permease [Planctomycetota bacterium]